mgnify:CR=1 FL=1
MHSNSLVKLPDGLNLWYQLRLAWALVSAPQGLVLQEDLLQGAGQVPVVDFVEALVIGLKGSAGEVCKTRNVRCRERTELLCTYSRSKYGFLVNPAFQAPSDCASTSASYYTSSPAQKQTLRRLLLTSLMCLLLMVRSKGLHKLKEHQKAYQWF